MPVDFAQVVDVNEVLVGPVVLLENGGYLLFVFVQVGLSAHGLHELVEADATGLLQVELGDDLIHCLLVGVEAVLLQQQGQVVGQEHAHAGGVVGVEYFLQVDDVFDLELACDVELGLEMLQVLSSEPDSVELVGVLGPALALLGTVAEFVVPVLLGGAGVGEGAGLGLVLVIHVNVMRI